MPNAQRGTLAPISNIQPGILAPIPPFARCISLQLSPDGDPRAALGALTERALGDELVVGIGQPLARARREYSRVRARASTDRASSPLALLVRRSMPWVDEDGEGLLFLGFGRSLEAYDALLSRMTGAEDGVVDGLFRFTRSITGGFYWCPPRVDGRLDLRAIRA